jgi:hypothetical protein
MMDLDRFLRLGEAKLFRLSFENSRFWLSASKTVKTTVWETIRAVPFIADLCSRVVSIFVINREAF